MDVLEINPWEKSPGQGLEDDNSNFEVKQLSEEEIKLNEELFQKKQEDYKEVCSRISVLEFQSRKEDEKELCLMEDYFDGNLDLDKLYITLNDNDNLNKDIFIEKEEKNVALKEENEKEKLLKYGKLADLSYIHLETNNSKDGNDKFDFLTVSLDPLSFPNIDKLFDNPNIASLTPDEKFLYEYINNSDNQNTDFRITLNQTNEEILKLAGLPEQKLAEAKEEYRNTLTDIQPKSAFDGNMQYRRLLLQAGLERLIVQKESEAKKNFMILKEDYNITNYFPNETRQDEFGEKLDYKRNSGLGAIILEKDGEKVLAIRGTEGISDWRDLLEDKKMVFGKIPDSQTKDLIEFIDRNIKPGEKFSIVGHSLGGALSQIATAVYPEQVKETYTFNSPGVKNLEVDKEDIQDFAKLKDFVYNKDKVDIQKLVTNVKGEDGISLIADLGEDIGDYEILLENLKTHSITDLVKYVEKLDENSEELKKIRLRDDSNNGKRKEI